MTAVTSDPVTEDAPQDDATPEVQPTPVEKPVDAEVKARIDSLALVPTQKEFTPEQKALLREGGIKNIDEINPAMLQGFLLLCLYRGVNPFIREATIMPTEDGWAAILGIDGFRVIAERTGEYLGMTEPEWAGDDGEWRNVWPKAWGRPQAARIGIKRLRPTGVEIFYGVVHTEEYEVFEWVQEEGKPRGQRTRRLTQRWEDGRQVKTLLIKCAKAAGFRDAFPREFDGFYAPEEVERLRRERREAEAQRLAAEAREARRKVYEEAQRAKEPERTDIVEGVQEGVVVNRPEPVPVDETMSAAQRLIRRVHERTPAAPAPEVPAARTPAASVAAPEVPADLPLDEEARAECLRAEITEQAAIYDVPVDAFVKPFAALYEGDPFSTWDSGVLLSVAAFWRPRVAAKLQALGRYEEARAYREAGSTYVDRPDVLFGRLEQPMGDGS